ncbi:LysE/ArgO family amino acid transporter [Demequina capsici]|uniref:LysE/ArgO family amino acid transporter n=1 Tax=Demequina capsici TaxID=3075620 RepID=A0AA96F8M5_9MICO|nr:LysE/ArgO family amino acid transporter [Demequina sp. PMTSA13]WNM26166.1 LysE/ArgO family amino acid transporter [Demequina sp. PMTSA13]
MTYVAGLGLSFSLIIAIGAQNVFVLRQGLRREHVLLVVAVCALSDAILIAVGVSGVGLAVVGLPWLVSAARWAGAAFLLVYGLMAARRAWRPDGSALRVPRRSTDAQSPGSGMRVVDAQHPSSDVRVVDAQHPSSGMRVVDADRGAVGVSAARRPTVEGTPVPSRTSSSGRRSAAVGMPAKGFAAASGAAAQTSVVRRDSLRATTLAVLAVTWLNPHVYLDTVLLMGTVAATHGEARWIFAAGAASGSVLWFTALGYGARLLAKPLARPGAWRVLDGGIGVIMLVLAVTLAAGA